MYPIFFILISLNDVSILKCRLYICCKNKYFRNKIIFFSFKEKKRDIVFIGLKYIEINNVMACNSQKMCEASLMTH